ncbi:MAG: hypothetical protein R6X02_04415 [Enhygromyxa sp.]
MSSRRPLLVTLLAAPLLLAACEDDKPKQDRKSVMEGGKAESKAGKQLEQAKQDIEAVEQQMQDKADENFEKSAGENAPRGLP